MRVQHTGSSKSKMRKVAVAAVGLSIVGCSMMASPDFFRRGLELSSSQQSVPLPDGVRLDEEGTCVNDRRYPTMHYVDRPDEVMAYKKWLTERFTYGRKWDRKPPTIHTLPPGTMFAHWDCPKGFCEEDKTTSIIDLGMSVWSPNGTDLVLSPRTWRHHGDYLGKARYRRGFGPEAPPTVVEGDVVFYVGFFYVNFGHVLHDSLPTIAYLRETLPDHTRFVLPDDRHFEKYLAFLDADFVRDRVIWAKENEVFQVKDGTVSIAVTHDELNCKTSMMNNHILFPYLRRWLREKKGNEAAAQVPPEDKHVIFHTRFGTAPYRVIDAVHERDIYEAVKRAMERHGINQPIVTFSGQDEKGEILPLQEQFDIFRRASAVIGPHGSGLANILWADPYPESCDDRLKLLEFIPMPDSAYVHMLYKGYYMWMGAMPIDWHVLGYAGNSTEATTYIRMKDLEEGLDAMWGPKNSGGMNEDAEELKALDEKLDAYWEKTRKDAMSRSH